MADIGMGLTYIVGDPRGYDPQSLPMYVIIERDPDYISYMQSIGYSVLVVHPTQVKMVRPPRVRPEDIQNLLDSGDYPTGDFIASADVEMPTVIKYSPETGSFRIYSWDKEILPTGEAYFHYRASSIAYGSIAEEDLQNLDIQEGSPSVYGSGGVYVDYREQDEELSFQTPMDVLKAIYREVKDLEVGLLRYAYGGGVGGWSGGGTGAGADLEGRIQELEEEMGEVADRLAETNQILGDMRDKFTDLVDNKFSPLFGEDGILAYGKAILGGFIEYVNEHVLPDIHPSLMEEILDITDELIKRDEAEGIEHMFDKMDWSWEE